MAKETYAQRIARGLAKGLSRSQARGHPTKGEQSIAALKRQAVPAGGTTERNSWMFAPDPTRKEWYLDPYSGEELSRTAWRKLKAQGGTPKINPRSSHYQLLLNAYVKEHGVSALKARHSPGFHAVLANLETADDGPASRKSWALVELGLRAPEWNWGVGETPTEVAA